MTEEKSIEELETKLAKIEAEEINYEAVRQALLKKKDNLSSDHCHHIRQGHAGNSSCAIDKRRPAWTTQEGECIDIESGCPKYVKS